MHSFRIYTLFILAIFLYWALKAVYLGIITPPNEGDSLIIHIPAAQRILEGTIFQLDYTKDLFYPSSIELLLSILIFFNIPLGLFNVLGVFMLFIGSFLLGKEVLKDKKFAIVFAASVSLLHGVIRWSFTQKPDIFVLSFLAFILWIVFLKKRSDIHYFLLGLFCAFFIGSKFNAPLFLIIILAPFYRIFVREFSIKKIVFFLIPLIPIGLSWYIRNIYITGDPFYFPDYTKLVTNGLISGYTFYGYITNPYTVFNAYISEYMIWIFGLLLVPIYLYINRKKIKDKENLIILKLFSSSFLIFLISLAFPYRELLHQMIGTMRYTLPMIFLFVLCLFIIARKHQLQKLFAIITIPTIIISQIEDYHPKILLIIIPVILFIYFRSRILSILKIRKLR